MSFTSLSLSWVCDVESAMFSILKNLNMIIEKIKSFLIGGSYFCEESGEIETTDNGLESDGIIGLFIEKLFLIYNNLK